MRTYIREVFGAVVGMILGLAIGFAVCPENIPALFGLESGLGTLGGIIGHSAFKSEQVQRRITYRRTQPKKNPGIVGGRRPRTRLRSVKKRR